MHSPYKCASYTISEASFQGEAVVWITFWELRLGTERRESCIRIIEDHICKENKMIEGYDNADSAFSTWSHYTHLQKCRQDHSHFVKPSSEPESLLQKFVHG